MASINKLRIPGFSAAHIGRVSDLEDVKVQRGEHSLLFMSPEILHDPDLHTLVKTHLYQERLRCVAIDEADCVSWRTFRKAWDAERIATFRTLVLCPFLAVTATLPEWQYKQVRAQLNMQDSRLVRPPSRRTNLFFEVRLRGKAWSDVTRDILDPIVSELLLFGDKVWHCCRLYSLLS